MSTKAELAEQVESLEKYIEFVDGKLALPAEYVMERDQIKDRDSLARALRAEN